MTYLSNWKITHNPDGSPLVLLDYGQEMEGEIPIGARKGLAVDPVLDGAPILQFTGEDLWDIRFGAIHTSADDAAARRAMIVKIGLGNSIKSALFAG